MMRTSAPISTDEPTILLCSSNFLIGLPDCSLHAIVKLPQANDLCIQLHLTSVFFQMQSQNSFSVILWNLYRQILQRATIQLRRDSIRTITHKGPRRRFLFRVNQVAGRQHLLASREPVELQRLHIHGDGLYIPEDAKEVEDLSGSRLRQASIRPYNKS